MKRVLILLLCVLLAVLILGCGREAAQPPTTDAPQQTEAPTPVPTETEPMANEATEPASTETEPAETESTEAQTEVPEPTEPEPTEPETTVPEPIEPEHSDLYLTNVPVEDILMWYNEVCLDTEFSNGGDATLVQKWTGPIVYMVHGAPTDEDLATLDGFARWLNSLEHFPGITRTENTAEANLNIHFTDNQGLVDIMGSEYDGFEGAVTYWYNNNAIYDEVICVRSDLDQYVRNSVILEEIYNGLGPIQDTVLRADSVIYQYSSEAQGLSNADKLILKLLYHSDIRCGMNAAECEAVIRTLYY